MINDSDSYKKRLEATLSKKITTVMIGSLSRIEEHILKNPKFKDVQEELQIVYEDVIRKEVLDLGNAQIRAMSEELSNYSITRNRVYTKFEVKPRN